MNKIEWRSFTYQPFRFMKTEKELKKKPEDYDLYYFNISFMLIVEDVVVYSSYVPVKIIYKVIKEKSILLEQIRCAMIRLDSKLNELEDFKAILMLYDLKQKDILSVLSKEVEAIADKISNQVETEWQK